MKKKDSILVIEDDGDKLFENVKKLQSDFETEKIDCPGAGTFLRQTSPRMVIFNLDDQASKIKEIVDLYIDEHPETYWVLSAPEVTHDVLVDFMRVGIRDFVRQPLDRTELENLMDRSEIWQTRRLYEKHRDQHQLISFFSCKGGVGLSISAVNLAVGFARRKLGRVLIADFVLQHGNVAELLDMAPHYTLMDLAENVDRLDTKLLDNSVERHKSGMFVLPCPKHPEESETFKPKETEKILKVLKQSFNQVVLDVGHELTNTTLACLDASDIIFLLTTPDLPSLCNTKIALDTFRKLGYPESKVRLILNRWHMKGEIENTDIQNHLGYPVFDKLVDDPLLVLSSINQGIPLREVDKRAGLVKGYEKLVERIAVAIPKETKA